jgi:hypothetical protein
VTEQATATADPQAARDYEQPRMGRFGAIALVAALLTIVSGFLLVASLAPSFDDRHQTIVQALGNNAEGRTDVEGAGAARLRWLADRPQVSLLPPVLSGLGALLMFPPLAFLFRAVRHRRPIGQLALVLAAMGAVLFGVGTIVTFALYYDAVASTGADDPSNSAIAAAITESAAVSAGGTIRALGAIALGAATVIIALNAMRVGLLPRFLGVLGIIVGGTLLLTGTPLPLDQQGLIRTFWLAAVGLLLIGKLPGGRPPAWQAGEAIPWPSASRPPAGATPPRRRGEPKRPVTPAPEPRAPHPASSKKRRKRRK